MKKSTPAAKPVTLLTLADLRIVRGAALVPTSPTLPKIDWTRTGYGEDSVFGYDPRDCD